MGWGKLALSTPPRRAVEPESDEAQNRTALFQLHQFVRFRARSGLFEQMKSFLARALVRTGVVQENGAQQRGGEGGPGGGRTKPACILMTPSIAFWSLLGLTLLADTRFIASEGMDCQPTWTSMGPCFRR